MKRKHRHGPRSRKRQFQTFKGLCTYHPTDAKVVIRNDAAPRLLASLRKTAKLIRNFNRTHDGDAP
jgi:hypothetical protein